MNNQTMTGLYSRALEAEREFSLALDLRGINRYTADRREWTGEVRRTYSRKRVADERFHLYVTYSRARTDTDKARAVRDYVSALSRIQGGNR